MEKTATFIFALIVIATLFTSTASSQEWYKGGTLHQTTVEKWLQASYRNRLATSGDWFINITKTRNPSLYKKLKKYRGQEFVVVLKMFSVQFEKAITDFASFNSNGRKACQPVDKIAEVASICYLTMYPKK